MDWSPHGARLLDLTNLTGTRPSYINIFLVGPVMGNGICIWCSSSTGSHHL